MRSNSDIYYIKTMRELQNTFDTANIKDRLDILNYLLAVEKLEDFLVKVKKCFSMGNLSEKQIARLNLFQLIYFIKEKDEYNSKKAKRELVRKKSFPMFYMQYLETTTFDEQINLFDRYITNNMQLIKLYFKKNKDLIHYLYIINLNREENIFNSKFLNLVITNKCKIIVNKKNISSLDLIYIWQILQLSSNNFLVKKIIERDFFLNTDTIEKILYKISYSKDEYDDIFSKSIKIKINESIIKAFRILFSCDYLNDEKLKRLNTDCLEFIARNKDYIESHTKYIFEISDQIECIDMTEIVRKIDDILNNKDEGDIEELIHIATMRFKSMSDFSEFLLDLSKISVDSSEITVLHRDCWNLSFSIVKFWAGYKFDYPHLVSNYLLDPFLTLCFKYENNEINYENFLKIANRLDQIHVNSIRCWDRLEKIFEKDHSFEWLILILNKLSVVDLKNNLLKTYISTIYINIQTNNKQMMFNSYCILDSRIREKISDIHFIYYSINIRSNIYRSFDSNLTNLVCELLQRFNEVEQILSNPLDIIDFVYLLVSINISENDNMLKKELIKIVTTNDLLKSNKILLFGLIFDDIELLRDNYSDIFKSIFTIFKENKVTDKDYVIISQITYILLEQDNDPLIDEDLYYHTDTDNFILAKYRKDEFEEVYNLLQIKTTETIHGDSNKSSLLFLLTSRIFFMNIENKKIGMAVAIPENADGYEILKTIGESIGYDSIVEKLDAIRSGNRISEFWFSFYNIHSYFKEIQLMKNNIFQNSKNTFIQYDKIIFHPSSLILAVKLDIDDIIKNDSRVHITGSIFNEVMRLKSLEIRDLVDGVLEDKVNYDDLLDKASDLMQDFYDKERVIFVTKAKIFGNSNLDKLSVFDNEIIKTVIENTQQSEELLIVTDDPLYYDLLTDISYGIFSYLVNCYYSNLITSSKLLDVTEKLLTFNYGFNTTKYLFEILLYESSNPDFNRVTDILQSHVIK